jgi:hypothetical protein
MTKSCEERIDDEYIRTFSDLDFMKNIIEADDWIDLDRDTLEFVEHDMGYDVEGDMHDAVVSMINEYGLFLGIDQNYHGTPYEYADELKVYTEQYGYGLIEACETMNAAPLHWQLSTGGPADGIVMTLEKYRGRWEIIKAVYYFQDWFDGAVRHVKNADLLTLKTVLEFLVDLDILFN